MLLPLETKLTNPTTCVYEKITNGGRRETQN